MTEAMALPLAPMRLGGADGLRLAAEAWGDADRAPLVLLHGGGQTRGAWAGAAVRLAALGWYVIAVDLRGHGESDWSPAGQYSIDHFAADVRALASSLGRPPVLVGASLGGLSSLLAAGEPAVSVGTPHTPAAAARALVLVDIAHRPEPVGVTRILEFMSRRPDGFESLQEAAAAVAAYLPHRSAPDSLEGLKRNLRYSNGRWIWHWDPSMLPWFSGPGLIPASAERTLRAARAVRAPILVARGALSDILTIETAREFCAEVPGAECVDVAGAGHMVAGDRNDRFVDALLPFLSRVAAR